jgi:hypothetical protein
MKFMFILFFILDAAHALAGQYNCRLRSFKLHLKLDGDFTTLMVKDLQSREIYYDGIVHEIVQGPELTNLIFQTDFSKTLKLEFKNSALENKETRLFGFADGWYGRGGVLNQSIQCMKITSSAL